MRQALWLLLVLLLVACAGDHEEPADAPHETGSEAAAPAAAAREPEVEVYRGFRRHRTVIDPDTASGLCELTPHTLEVAQQGDFTLACTVGAGGIAPGGGLYIEYPKAWFTDPGPQAKPVQTDEPDADHHLAFRCSRPGCRLGHKFNKVNIDGERSAFPHKVRVIVEEPALEAGDRLEVAFLRTTAPRLAGRGEIRVAVDSRGTVRFQLMESPVAYEVSSGTVSSLALFAPSQAVVGQPVELQVTAFDAFHNPVHGLEGRVSIEGLDSPFDASLREGRAVVHWTPSRPGFFWPRVSHASQTGDAASGQRLEAAGGPVRVFDSQPQHSIYWGDLHSHSSLSCDAIGLGDFEYARNITRLDFFAGTERAEDCQPRLRDGLTPDEWRLVQDRVRRFHEPGRFVTLLGYECGLRRKGHHNVYYRSLDGLPWPAHQTWTAEGLWQKLEPGQAITIPHPYPRPPDWTTPHDQTLRPLLQIDPSHHGAAADLPAQQAWQQGLRLGLLASSGTRQAQPGLPHAGLAAVLATELDRDALFGALQARHTYATTGERIYLELEVGGVAMGDSGRASGKLGGKVTVAAPGPIAQAEVLALSSGTSDWRVAARWDHPGRLLEADFEDEVADRSKSWYLRVALEEQGGRTARAWSSPVWLDP